jgi:hypothetical protein
MVAVRRRPGRGTSARVVALVIGTVLALLTSGCGSDSSGATEPSPTSSAALGDTAALDEAAIEADIVSATATSERVEATTVLSSPTTFDARVSVPDTALPAGLAADEVTAEIVSLHRPEEGISVVSFALGPDGTRFDEPVVLEWDGPWAADAQLSLDVVQGDGTVVDDPGTSSVNSLSALSIEPTSDNTAHYRLPIDHFSTWQVTTTFESWGTPIRFTATADLPSQVVAGETTEVLVSVSSTEAQFQPGTCASGLITATRNADASLRAPHGTGVSCSFGQATTEVVLTLDLTCSQAGTATVDAVVYGLVVADGLVRPTTSISATDYVRRLMLEYSYRLGGSGAVRTAIVDNQELYRTALMVGAPVTFDVTCVAPLTASSAAGSTTTTVSGTTRPGSTTTAPSGTTTRTTGTATSTTTPIRATTTLAGGPVSTAPASTTLPTTSSAPSTTTTRPATTSTSTSTSTTSAPSSSTTTSSTGPASSTTTSFTGPWGAEGMWAYNEYGSCNWNGSGGCGWYFGSSVGTYLLGPLGSPGATW